MWQSTQSIRSYTKARGPTMTKRQRLPGISLRIEECTRCGANSGLSETLGESYAHETDSGSPHLWVISVPVPVPVPVSVSVLAFPCLPVARMKWRA